MGEKGAALQGYMLGIGNLGSGWSGGLIRLLVGLSGMTLALPAGGLFGFSQILLFVLAFIFMAAAMGLRTILSAPAAVQSN